MKRRPIGSFANVVRVGLVLALAGSMVACAATRRPLAEMAAAEHAVQLAQSDTKAYHYAPVELRSAEDKLALARQAMSNGDYEDARYLAELARAEAQLAEARGEARFAQGAVVTSRQVETVRDTDGDSSSTVVERTTTSRPGVVVEPAPSRTVTTVVEQPLGMDVIREERSVVVIPE
ncbi:MAG TPA: DUF4398 domain-containing protein [Candidatus Binatia bacterium]